MGADAALLCLDELIHLQIDGKASATSSTSESAAGAGGQRSLAAQGGTQGQGQGQGGRHAGAVWVIRVSALAGLVATGGQCGLIAVCGEKKPRTLVA